MACRLRRPHPCQDYCARACCAGVEKDSFRGGARLHAALPQRGTHRRPAQRPAMRNRRWGRDVAWVALATLAHAAVWLLRSSAADVAGLCAVLPQVRPAPCASQRTRRARRAAAAAGRRCCCSRAMLGGACHAHATPANDGRCAGRGGAPPGPRRVKGHKVTRGAAESVTSPPRAHPPPPGRRQAAHGTPLACCLTCTWTAGRPGQRCSCCHVAWWTVSARPWWAAAAGATAPPGGTPSAG
jgi:hypothetical protein